MTETQKKMIDTYIEKDEMDTPDMAPTKEDLENPIPLLKEIPLKKNSVPKAVSWSTFWDTGLTTIINNIITAFGFGICAQRDSDGRVVNVYPVRTNYRGLSEADTIIGLEHFSRFNAENAKTLYNESYLAERKLLEAAQAYEKENDAPSSESIIKKISDDPNMQIFPAFPDDVRVEPLQKQNKATSRFLRDQLASQGIDISNILDDKVEVQDVPGDNPPTATFSVDDNVPPINATIDNGELAPDDSEAIGVNPVP